MLFCGLVSPQNTGNVIDLYRHFAGKLKYLDFSYFKAGLIAAKR
jgi:hypothetical protein